MFRQVTENPEGIRGYMEKLLLIIANGLIGDSANGTDARNARVIRLNDADGIVTYRLLIPSADMGKVIGKGGKIARAIRTVAKAGAIKSKEKINVEICEYTE
jgi:predicted RNA-binding protein YlqC (UPF0109 family)